MTNLRYHVIGYDPPGMRLYELIDTRSLKTLSDDMVQRLQITKMWYITENVTPDKDIIKKKLAGVGLDDGISSDTWEIPDTWAFLHCVRLLTLKTAGAGIIILPRPYHVNYDIDKDSNDTIRIDDKTTSATWAPHRLCGRHIQNLIHRHSSCERSIPNCIWINPHKLRYDRPKPVIVMPCEDLIFDTDGSPDVSPDSYITVECHIKKHLFSPVSRDTYTLTLQRALK